ncbi:MAG: NTP transferase domain-containing protein, partial [Thermoanaerobaculia bacterium]
SIRAGVRLAGDSRILIMLCDQPLITTEHLRDLIAIDAPIVATGYAGIAGVPAVFAPEFASELLALRGDRGARVVIEAHRDVTRLVIFEDAAVDIDSEDDLRKLITR